MAPSEAAVQLRGSDLTRPRVVGHWGGRDGMSPEKVLPPLITSFVPPARVGIFDPRGATLAGYDEFEGYTTLG
jgi:hypothetical protein